MVGDADAVHSYQVGLERVEQTYLVIRVSHHYLFLETLTIITITIDINIEDIYLLLMTTTRQYMYLD